MRQNRATRWGLWVVTIATLFYGGMHGLLAAPPAKPKPDAKPVSAGVLGMMFGANADDRLVIVEVAPNSVADTVGVMKKDVLVSFDGHQVSEKDDLIQLAIKSISAKEPGDELEIVVRRNGRLRTMTLLVPEEETPPASEAVAKVLDENYIFCMVLRETESGRVIVQKVQAGSPAHQAGILPKDEIATFGEAKIGSIVQFRDAVRRTKLGQEVAVGLVRDREPLVTQVVMADCSGEVAVPVAAVDRSANLARLAAQLKVLRAQIDELQATAEEIAVEVQAMQRP
ncbi:MAG: PDZ domain-containing protein [Pirellulales bacterium]